MDKLMLGLKVKTLREHKKWSQSKLAEIIDISDNTLSNIETGRHYPRLETFDALSIALDISASFLLSDDENVNAMCLEEIRKYLIIFDERIAEHVMDYILMCSELCDKLNDTKDYKRMNFSWYKDLS